MGFLSVLMVLAMILVPLVALGLLAVAALAGPSRRPADTGYRPRVVPERPKYVGVRHP